VGYAKDYKTELIRFVSRVSLLITCRREYWQRCAVMLLHVARRLTCVRNEHGLTTATQYLAGLFKSTIVTCAQNSTATPISRVLQYSSTL